MKIGDVELLEYPLETLRAILGDERVDELFTVTMKLCAQEARSVEELVYLAEHFRLLAELQAGNEEQRVRRSA